MSVRCATANTDWAKRGDPKYLDRLTALADVLLLQEAKDVIVGDHLPDGWVSLQQGVWSDPPNKALMGSCVAYNSAKFDVVHAYTVLGAEPFWLGRRLGMLTRYIAVAILRDLESGRHVTVVSAHAPPFRFRLLQPGYRANLARELTRHRNWIVGTDANEPIRGLGKVLGAQSYGRGIVGFVSNLHMSNVVVRKWGVRREFTDHPAVTATAEFPKETP